MSKKSQEYRMHHYVPETYLKHFGFAYSEKETKVYAYPRERIVKNVPTKLDPYTPAMICKKEYLYKIDDPSLLKFFNIEDANIVEKTAFKLFEDNYDKYLSKILSGSIPSDESKVFIRSLINLKERHPYYMFHQDKVDSIKEVNELIIQEIKNNYELYLEYFRLHGCSVEIAIQKLRKWSENSHHAKNVIAVLMLASANGERDTAQVVIAELLMTKMVYLQNRSQRPIHNIR